MKATIIGGGITGLTIAVGLQKAGHDFAIYETAEAFKPIGAGIILSPNALYVYDQLGLYEELAELGHPLRFFNISDVQGKVIQENDTRFILHGKPYASIGIHRGDLQRVLLSHIDKGKIHLGKLLEAVTAVSKDLHFKDGDTIRADYVLACDGIHSAVRQSLFPKAKLRYSGQTCWRGVADIDLSVFQLGSPAELWGNGLRFGYVPLGYNRVYWYGTAVSPPQQRDSDLQTTKQKLLAHYRSFAPFVHNIIAATPAIMRHDLFDLSPIQTWTQGDFLLLGDAAHAMTPNLGQGAAQGIEDAWAIVKLLGQHPSHRAAFAAVQAARYEKANLVAKRSWQIGQVTNWQNRLLCRLRNSLMSYAPKSAADTEKARLFNVPAYL
ncbi:MAG: FAD-dependent monooxygenase [Chloroflexota bacterium]